MSLRGVSFRGFRFEGQAGGVVVQAGFGRAVTLSHDEWVQVVEAVEGGVAEDAPGRHPRGVVVEDSQPIAEAEVEVEAEAEVEVEAEAEVEQSERAARGRGRSGGRSRFAGDETGS